MSDIMIKTYSNETLIRFLALRDFDVEDLGNDVFCISRDDELPVFLKIEDNALYFEADLGPVAAIASQDLFQKLLDLNTEILPVSVAINSTNPDDNRLVLVESRITGDLSEDEILSVFDAMELAVEKLEAVLNPHLA